MPDVNAYARMLKQLLPPGRLWLTEPTSTLSRVMLAIAEELVRVEARGAALVEESDPSTATETLPEWERLLGLPDSAVLEVPSTVEGRRLAVVQKLLGRGGSSRAFFITLAAACGYTVSIDDAYGARVLRVGFQAEAPAYDVVWAHAWLVTVQPPTGPALTTAELERIIRRAAPAHTAVLFHFL